MTGINRTREASRIAGLQSVDRHVLGAVVLERAADFLGAAHEQQIADEDRDADDAFGELEAEALRHAAHGCLGDQER